MPIKSVVQYTCDRCNRSVNRGDTSNENEWLVIDYRPLNDPRETNSECALICPECVDKFLDQYGQRKDESTIHE